MNLWVLMSLKVECIPPVGYTLWLKVHTFWDVKLERSRINSCHFTRKDTDGRGDKLGIRFQTFHLRLFRLYCFTNNLLSWRLEGTPLAKSPRAHANSGVSSLSFLHQGQPGQKILGCLGKAGLPFCCAGWSEGATGTWAPPGLGMMDRGIVMMIV